MKKLILVAGAATLAFTGPALAKPPHAAHGKTKGQGVAALHSQATPFGYGVGGCPPGLAKKAVPCVPPGQVGKLAVGQRVPFASQSLLGYNALPTGLRTYYGAQLDPRSRYVYDNSYLYRVDPTTLVVQQVLSAILR